MTRSQPIADLDTEGALLSAALLDSGALDAARSAFGDRDEVFFADSNRRVWEAITSLDDEGAPVDLPSVAGRLRETGRLDQIGGTPYLAQLVSETPAVAQVEYHAKKLIDLALTRRMVAACQTVLAESHGPIETAKWARRKADEIQDLIGADVTKAQERDIRDLMKLVIDEMSARRRGEKVEGATPVGWRGVDALLGGWLDGNFYVAAGRPGMGKTSLAGQACLNVAQQPGKMSLFLGLEMPDVQVGQRMLSIQSGVPVTRIIRGNVNAAEQSRIMTAAAELARLPLFLGDNCGQTVAQLRAVVRRQVRRLRSIHGEGMKIGLISIDYLQLIKTPYKQGRSRENEVSDISGGLKMMASEFQCPVLALSQLSRKCEERPDKRPQLSDLRESGAIEQDAYGILFLYRDDYYAKEKSPDPGVCEVNVAKHRNGPTGVVKLDFNAEITRFDDMAEQYGDFASAASDPMPDWKDN